MNLRRLRSSPRPKLDNPEALNREHTEVVVQPGESKDVFLPRARPEPMICGAATMIGTAWWAASPSASSGASYAALSGILPVPHFPQVNLKSTSSPGATG